MRLVAILGMTIATIISSSISIKASSEQLDFEDCVLLREGVDDLGVTAKRFLEDASMRIRYHPTLESESILSRNKWYGEEIENAAVLAEIEIRDTSYGWFVEFIPTTVGFGLVPSRITPDECVVIAYVEAKGRRFEDTDSKWWLAQEVLVAEFFVSEDRKPAYLEFRKEASRRFERIREDYLDREGHGQ